MLNADSSRCYFGYSTVQLSRQSCSIENWPCTYCRQLPCAQASNPGMDFTLKHLTDPPFNITWFYRSIIVFPIFDQIRVADCI